MDRRNFLKNTRHAGWAVPSLVTASLPSHAQTSQKTCSNEYINAYIQVRLSWDEPVSLPRPIDVRFESSAFDITRDTNVHSDYIDYVALYIDDIDPNLEFTGTVAVSVIHPEIKPHTERVPMTTVRNECNQISTERVYIKLQRT